MKRYENDGRCFAIVGDADPMVRLEWGRLSEELFRKMGFEKYRFQVYPGMAHSSSDQVRRTKSSFDR